MSVTDALPTGLQLVSAEGTGWACAEASGTVTCDLAGPLAPETTAETITLTVLVLPALITR